MSVGNFINKTVANASLNITNTTAPVGIAITAGQIDMTWVVSAPAIEVCAVAMVVSVLLSAVDMWHHVSEWEHPKLQSGTVRILFMVPIYAILSWAILLYPSSQFVLRTIRDTYEAFVLYQFLALLVEYCGGEAQLIQSLERKKHRGIHPWPFCCLPLFDLDRGFYVRCKRWVLQYALLKPLMALIALVANPLGWYDEANFDWKTNLYPWLFMVYNVSISYSLYYLVIFDLETHRELAYCKPLLKFVCIKAIIFFSYWQSAALSIMLSAGLLYTGSTESQQSEISGCIQEFLICLELVPIAILHHFGFGVTKLEEEMEEQPLYESAENTRRSGSKLKRLDEALSLGQFFKDTASAVFTKANQLTHVVSAKRDPHDPHRGMDDEELKLWGLVPGATKQSHSIFSKVAWPAEQNIALGSDGSESATEVALCTVVALSRGTATTRQVMGAARQMDDAAEDGRRTTNIDDDDYDEDDTDDDDSDDLLEDDDINDEKQQDRASRDAFSFGIRVDDFQFVVSTAKSINAAVSKVLFDDNAGPSVGDFCVVCGRNDRAMVHRKSGMKCKECLGTKHNYNVTQ